MSTAEEEREEEGAKAAEVLRTKTFYLEPMTQEEALEQARLRSATLLGHTSAMLRRKSAWHAPEAFAYGFSAVSGDPQACKWLLGLARGFWGSSCCRKKGGEINKRILEVGLHGHTATRVG